MGGKYYSAGARNLLTFFIDLAFALSKDMAPAVFMIQYPIDGNPQLIIYEDLRASNENGLPWRWNISSQEEPVSQEVLP